MITNHLTEEQLQQYALHKIDFELQVHAHIEACKDCESKVIAYQLLFTAISEQAAPVFDFNLAETVMAQLPVSKVKASHEKYLIYTFGGAFIFLTGITAYLCRQYLIAFFTNTSLISYLAMVTITMVLIILCIDNYKNYRQKMKLLDLY